MPSFFLQTHQSLHSLQERQEGEARYVTDWKSLMKQKKWKVSVTPAVSTNFWFSYPIKLILHKTF